jgi:hypothetical protein
MTAGQDALILHQYDISPYSEKIRGALGFKGLAWLACDQPVIMPKPELVALTGGYRRIPVLQIGSDIYCDSDLILDEIERKIFCTQLGSYPSTFLGTGYSREERYPRDNCTMRALLCLDQRFWTPTELSMR